jgi:uncharacterized protein YxjI
MEININQKKISIGDKYKIFIDGQQSYSASTKLFRLLDEIELFEEGINRPKYTLYKNWAWFNTSYNLKSFDNNGFEFRTKSFWKNHYECRVGPDLYEIFGHRGRKYSVFKNNKQIAWWSKSIVTWFEGDNYTIIADQNCDYELIISFCLIIDNAFSNSKNDNAVTIDLGTVLLQARKFDTTWQPSY